MKKLVSALIVAAVACSAASPRSKLARELASMNTQGMVPVIIQWTMDPTATHEQKVRALGGTRSTHLHGIKGGLYKVPASALASLANDPDVAFISPDRPIKAKLDNTAGAVNASAAWNAGFTGSGVGVAVIDSGVNADPNLGTGHGGGPVYSYDFTQPLAASNAAAFLASHPEPLQPGLGELLILSLPAPDQFGHGQHVAGIIASNGSGSECNGCTRVFRGISYGASIIDLKVLDANGQGTDSNVILAIDAAIALKNVYNIRVINLSVGRPVVESYTLDPLCQAVEAAWRAGIVVVAAAGNDGRDNTYGEQGYGTINAPGNDPYVITVGAMKTQGTPARADDLMASYSSKGPTAVDHLAKPDLVAPGNLVVSLLAPGSTLAHQNPQNVVAQSYYNSGRAQKAPQNYFILSGTSMATPVISAAAADLLQANPKLTPDQVKAILMQTAYKTFPQSSSVTDAVSGQTFVDYYDLFTVGAGYLDLGAAMAMANNPPPSGTAMSPVASLDSTSGALTLAFDPSSIWSDRSMWGTRSMWGAQSLWGASVLNGNQLILDSRSMWGAQSTDASRSMWGAQAIYSDRSMWGADSTSSSQSDSSARSMWGADVTVTGEN